MKNTEELIKKLVKAEKIYRKEKGFNQERMGEDFEFMPQQRLSKIEKGEVVPTLDEVICISQVIGFPLLEEMRDCLKNRDVRNDASLRKILDIVETLSPCKRAKAARMLEILIE